MTGQPRYRFALVAHSAEIADCVRRVARYEDYDLDYQVATFETVIPTAQKYLDDGYEVVLCHGGSGRSIVRGIGHRVAAIDRTDMDVIKALRTASRLSGTIALATYLDEVHDVATMQELLGITIHHIVYSTWEEMFEKVRQAYAQGVHVLVGGGISKNSMESQGGTGFVIEPSPHSIRKALEQARAIARRQRLEAARQAALVDIFKHVQDGVVCIDHDGDTVFFNQKAANLLKLPPNPGPEALRAFHGDLLLTDVLGQTSVRQDVIVDIKGEPFVVTAMPLTAHTGSPGAVAFFRDVPSLQNINRKISKELYQKGFVVRSDMDGILGSSEAIGGLKRKIARFAPTDATVFINGETGVGKELAAHALHAASLRRDKAFVAVNCAAIPKELIESELFGYEDGAFSGAKRGGKMGLFEMADGGSIFLDEVGEISHEMQLRLLRVLESKEIMRLGDTCIRTVDVRVISASNRALMDLVGQGRFRLDLHYRLSTLNIVVPPLRERLEDLPLLLEKPLRQYGKSGRAISAGMLAAMARHDWPGNVRELLSMIETYLILLDGDEADEALFLKILRESATSAGSRPLAQAPPQASMDIPTGLTLKQSLARDKAARVRAVVEQCGGDRNEAARRLGISPVTLWRALRGNG